MDDKIRVLYTALTRATQALYMVGDAAYLSLHFPQWSAIVENLQKWASTGLLYFELFMIDESVILNTLKNTQN